MRIQQIANSNLFAGGKDEFEKTGAFRDGVNKIVADVTNEYASKLRNQTNWLSKCLVRLFMEMEIRKKIRQFSSLRNLHVMD